MTKIMIKDWFLNKKKDELLGHIGYFLKWDVDVLGETEKAYQVMVEWETLDGENGGFKKFWCPKSCTMTIDEYNAEVERKAQAFKDGCAAYEKLIAFAKANKVKGVRKGLKKETIMNKIREAGLEYTA